MITKKKPSKIRCEITVAHLPPVIMIAADDSSVKRRAKKEKEALRKNPFFGWNLNSYSKLNNLINVISFPEVVLHVGNVIILF